MATVIGENPNVKKRCTCQKCAAIIEYAEGEVRVLWSGTDYGGGPDGAKGFPCPRCGQDVIVERW
jgi:hypothetical protein